MHCLRIGFGLLLMVLLNAVGPRSVLAIFCGDSPCHYAFFGMRRFRDEILFNGRLVVKPKPDTVFIRSMSFPIKHGTRGNITFIEAYDQYNDGNGGCAWILDGGPEYDFVTIGMQSQQGYGIDFDVTIYGFKYEK